MKLTILGSATPYPRPDNPCSGYLVQSETTALWVDAGTGTLAEIQRHISLDQLDGIFISHGHADHTADLLTAYYALRFSSFVLPHPLPLYGPPGLGDQLVGFLGHRSAAVLPEVFTIAELRGWDAAELGDLRLEWGPVDHGMPAFGLRITGPGGVIAYSGDTAYCEGVVELAEGADLFLCETGMSDHAFAGETDGSHPPAVHCSPEDAGRIAFEAGVRRLVLTHITSELGETAAISRASALFGGSVEVAESGLILLTDAP